VRSTVYAVGCGIIIEGDDIMTLCSDAELQEATALLAAGGGDDIATIDRLLAAYPQDPRLHFLRGSLLAGIGRPIEALSALRKAVELAPDFTIARFQLGFFQLTSGEAVDALSTWGPLALLPQGHYLRSFVGGLTYLIRDEFPQAVEQLRLGIAANDENPPLNRDMQLIIDRIGDITAATGEDSNSATSFLLGQFTGGRPN
jgi:tetratricopeptide (TPR) repeat protein